ncbi:MAG: glycosyltransferase, partial [Myxococcales bacterium]|nr:glycosyltransferase [Myxococcales bacterium]
ARVARLAEHPAGMARALGLARRHDVVHVQWLPVPEIDVAPLHALARLRPLVYTAHNATPHDAPPTPAQTALWRAIYRAPRAIVAHDAATAGALTTTFGVPAERVHRLPHGNFAYLDAHPAPPAPPTDLLAFGFIGPYKGLDVLLDALPRVRRAVPDVHLRVVGRPRGDVGEVLARVRALAREGRAELDERFVPDGALPSLFDAARLVVLPYREISQSGVAVLAATRGRAIVASDVGGLGELVRAAGCGLLAPPGDADALADAIVALLTDDDARAACAERGRAFARGALAWGPIAARTAALYRLIG